jgi:hypothetical protein
LDLVIWFMLLIPCVESAQQSEIWGHKSLAAGTMPLIAFKMTVAYSISSCAYCQTADVEGVILLD